jgi:hypothetical protein
MPSLAQQARTLQARADRLEEDLAAVILDLDEDAIARLAQDAVEEGFTRAEVEAVFSRVNRHIGTVYDTFGREAAEEIGVTPPTVRLQTAADTASGMLVSGLSQEAEQVVQRLISQAIAEGWGYRTLADALQAQIGLTDRQNAYVASYERKLRTDRRLALKNQLRDKRFDRRVRGKEPLSESEIDRMVARYRQNWLRARSIQISRQELYRAANATNQAAYEEADSRGVLAKGTRKFWVHMHDTHVRHSHLEIPVLNADGVAIADSFVTPLGRLRYPLDPLGLPEDVIGCRCVLVFNAKLPEGAS